MKAQNKTLFIALWATLIILLGYNTNAQQEVEFNYNGRVRVGNDAFNGTGQFKFALVSQNGQTTYWSNDSTSTGGSEPTTHVFINVIDGFFSVAIGDTLLGMDALSPTLFNEDDRIFLRVWFNDGINGFQKLNPDRRVINPALLGQQSFDQDIILYVDGTNGLDSNNGLTTSTAKKTIQSAVNVLPNKTTSNISIKVLPGIYRESASILSVAAITGKTIEIIGDESWTPLSVGDPSVIIAGNDIVSGPAVRENGFEIQQCTNINITGLKFTDFVRSGIKVQHSSLVLIENCLFENAKQGIFTSFFNGEIKNCISKNHPTGSGFQFQDSHVVLRDSEAINNANGVALRATEAFFYNVNCSNNVSSGLIAQIYSRVEMWPGFTSTFSNNNFGINAINSAIVSFAGSAVISNNAIGMSLQRYSYSVEHLNATFTSNVSDIVTATGGDTF